jgi:hypothetical protein
MKIDGDGLSAIAPAKRGIFTMRFASFSLALSLAAISAFAQEKQDVKDGASQTSTSVRINGQSIKGKVLEIDGKHFVAVEDLAQSLRGTISYSEGQIALTLLPPPAASAPLVKPAQQAIPASPPPQPPQTAAQRLETGRIEGTLTYFFDFHTGNKPDTGSKIWLVKDHIAVPADQDFVGSSTSLGTSANPEEYHAIQYSTADANGNFEMLDIPSGQYTLILQSAHTKGTLRDKRDFFGRGNHPNLRDSIGRVETIKVMVKPGETFNATKDFGPDTAM